MHVLKYVLYQLTTGLADPRPRWANPVKPPADVTVQSIRPGLWLEGRVTRAVPFGVFVDVGLGAEALVPLPHVGDRPGLEPSTVAPVGAVITARVLEVDVVKRRLTLTMRPEREGGFRGEGPRRDGARGRGPVRAGAFSGPARGGERGPSRAPEGVGASGERSPFQSDGRRPERGFGRGPRREGAPAGVGEGGGAHGRRGGSGPRAGGGDGPPRGGMGGPPRGGGGGGRFGGGGGAKSGVGMGMGRAKAKRPEGDRFGRDDPSAPRRISLPMDTPATPAADAPVDESALTPEQVLAKKLEELKKRLSRPD
jgi:predicted RNA-binding protein with RPS1 domain